MVNSGLFVFLWSEYYNFVAVSGLDCIGYSLVA